MGSRFGVLFENLRWSAARAAPRVWLRAASHSAPLGGPTAGKAAGFGRSAGGGD